MKKNEIVEKLNKALESKDIKAEIASLLEELATSSQTDEGKWHYFVKVNERVLDPAKKYPRQMIVVHEILEALGKDTLSLDEVKAAIGEHADQLQTRQDPYRIYAFYQKPMEEAGWITKEKVRM